MISFSSFEGLVQHHLDDKSFSLSQTRHLRAMNRIHRLFVQKRRWAEHTVDNTTMTTVAGQETYNWPITQAFYEEPRVDLLDVSDSNRPYPLHPVADEVEWADYWSNSNGDPEAYRRLSVNGVAKLALRPIPDTTGDIISLRGRVEPRAFLATNYTTVDDTSASGQAVLNVAATTMFAIGDYVIINEGGAREEIGTILSISAGASITLTGNLTYSHTGAQADRVERMTKFLQSQADEAFAMLLAAELKAKRGFSARALELVNQANQIMPETDTNPRPQTTMIRPSGIGC